MQTVHQLSAAPLTSLTTPSGSHVSGVSFLFILVLLAVGSALFLLYIARRQQQTVVVVDQSAGFGSFLGFLIAVGVLVVFLMNSGTGVS